MPAHQPILLLLWDVPQEPMRQQGIERMGNTLAIVSKQPNAQPAFGNITDYLPCFEKKKKKSGPSHNREREPPWTVEEELAICWLHPIGRII